MKILITGLVIAFLIFNTWAEPGGTYVLTGNEKSIAEIIEADVANYPDLYKGERLNVYISNFKRVNRIGKRKLSPGDELIFPDTLASIKSRESSAKPNANSKEESSETVKKEEGKVLLMESFDKSSENGFADEAIRNEYITLVEGGGRGGTDAIRVAYVGYEKGSHRVVFRKPLKESVEQATLSYDVCFDKEFKWVMGGKLHGLGPKKPITGGNPRRPDGWSARVNFKDKGKVATYLYDQDMSLKWGQGQKSKKPVFTAGQWHHVTLQLQLNDPGQSNGFANVYIDSELILATENVAFRGTGGANTETQQFLFSTFHGGNTPNYTPVDKEGEPTTVYATFDNFLVVEGIHQSPPR